MLFWKLFFSALSIIVVADLAGQSIIARVRRQRKGRTKDHD